MDKSELKAAVNAWRRNEVQAIGAAISTRNWHNLEVTYNSLRDKMDAALRALAKEDS